MVFIRRPGQEGRIEWGPPTATKRVLWLVELRKILMIVRLVINEHKNEIANTLAINNWFLFTKIKM